MGNQRDKSFLDYMVLLVLVLGCLVCFVLIVSDAQASDGGNISITLTCDYPTTREDGTAFAASEVKEARFYFSTCDGRQGHLVSRTGCKATLHTPEPEKQCKFIFEATVIDNDGLESSRGVPFDYTWLMPRPRPPVNGKAVRF